MLHQTQTNLRKTMKLMLPVEENARRIMRRFEEMMTFDLGLNWKLGMPHPVELVDWTWEGKARVKMGPHQVLDINPATTEKFTHVGTYGSAETLKKAFLSRAAIFGRVQHIANTVALFRRSGIKEIGELGKNLTADFETVPQLRLRLDDYGLWTETRIRYALACAARVFKKGEAHCPHCNGAKWDENIMGWQCLTCDRVWSDHPGSEGWMSPWKETAE
jgi:hypothetical protein